MEDTSGVTIWRYIDLAKFVSMLAGEALYLACPCELDDPYEGYLPKHYFDALSVPIQEIVDEQLQRRAQIANDRPDVDLAAIDAGFVELRSRLQGAVKNVSLKFGVNCWHMNDHESEAMWKVYSAAGHGIAMSRP